MAATHSFFILDAERIRNRINELSDVLEDCVNQGASVSFVLPFGREKSLPFWTNVAQGVTGGERIVLAAENGAGVIVGTDGTTPAGSTGKSTAPCRRGQTVGSLVRAPGWCRQAFNGYAGKLRKATS